jgi:arginine decarboxylase
MLDMTTLPAVKRALSRSAVGLTIPVRSAVGSGPTPVAAFDRALLSAGIANLNLVRLSSVIPAGARVEIHVDNAPLASEEGVGWGDRHYVVYADARASRPGEVAAACVGWVQDEATGAGLFVEVEGDDEDRARAEVVASLDAMTRTREIDLGRPTLLSRSIRCEDQPVCALVVASFTTEAWT